MTQPQIKNIFFAITSCILFVTEIMVLALLQSYDLYLLLCFFIALLTQTSQKRTLVPPLLFMCIISYLEMNIFGWCLVYIVPTIMLARYLDQHLRVKIIIPYLLITFALCFKMFMAWYMHNISISLFHATNIIVDNSLIIALFSIIGAYLEKWFYTPSL